MNHAHFFAARLIVLLLAALAVPVAAGRDFLTTDEADQVRLAQEPNDRLKLYADFALQRLDLVEHLLAKPETGRSTLVREALEDFTKIIETIDIVADDALARGVDATLGIQAVAEAEKAFLERLHKIEEARPKDLVRYEFVLATAIETTEDSLEINNEDLAARKTGVAEREEREDKETEELMTPGMRKERQGDAAVVEKQEEKRRKAPTLYKKGEKDQQKP